MLLQERDLNFFVIKVENRGVKKQSQSKVPLLISVKEEFKAKSIIQKKTFHNNNRYNTPGVCDSSTSMYPNNITETYKVKILEI